jgi:hypothetical protein
MLHPIRATPQNSVINGSIVSAATLALKAFARKISNKKFTMPAQEQIGCLTGSALFSSDERYLRSGSLLGGRLTCLN